MFDIFQLMYPCEDPYVHEQEEAMKIGNMAAGNQQKHLLLSFSLE